MSPTETQSPTNPTTPVDPAISLASFWAQWLEQSSRGTQALLEAMQTLGDPQQIQSRWLDAVARSLEDFMRTPAFLELIKNNLKTITDLKNMQNQIVQDTARQIGVPMTGDITGLFERLHSVEQTILQRLDALEARLHRLEQKPTHRVYAGEPSSD
jgi:predicted component of type VI protein secretion system